MSKKNRVRSPEAFRKEIGRLRSRVKDKGEFDPNERAVRKIASTYFDSNNPSEKPYDRIPDELFNKISQAMDSKKIDVRRKMPLSMLELVNDAREKYLE